MMRLRYRTILLVAVSILLAATGETCGPEFAGLVFTREHGPDGPISAFTKGKIGIPLPSWWRAYLVVAYRYFEGKPLSADEARSFAEFWGTEQKFGFPSDPANKALEKWVKARAQFEPANPQNELKAYKESGFNSQLNCTASAFNTAVETLHARAQRFGAASQELHEWIAGQDAVFKNCDGDDKNPVHPNALPATADPLLHADRNYQIAAAHFYSGHYSDAEAGFDAISQDGTSPWQPIAPYLAARAVIRQVSDNLDGISEPERRAKDVPLVKDAERRLKAVLDDPGRERWHHDAHKLLNLIAFRTEPLQYQHRLAKEILGGAGADFGQDVRDYTLLLDKYLDEEPDFPGVDRYGDKYYRKLEQWRGEQYEALWHERSDELTDWIMTFQSESKAAAQHAIKKWQVTKSLPWLYVTLTKLNGADRESSAAIEAAAKTGPESPLFVALNYQRIRLLQEKGDSAGAREALKKLLAIKQDFSLSTLNLVQDEQMKVSQEVAGFVSQLARQPVRMSNDWYDDTDNGCYNQQCKLTFYGVSAPSKNSRLALQLDLAAARLLNTQIPTDVLVQIVNEKALPGPLQQRMATAVWARGALLDQPDAAAKVSDAAIAAAPELKRFTQELATAKNHDERRFVAAFAIAHFPGLRPFVDTVFPRQTEFAKIDDYRDNWWCSDIGGIPDKTNYEKQWDTQTNPGSPAGPPPAFLTQEQAEKAKLEWKSLLRTGAAEDYLPAILIRWAKTHPDDPRVPEALHYSWRVSRYACSEPGSHGESYNRQAFKMLHKNYPQSEWTKKTKVWF